MYDLDVSSSTIGRITDKIIPLVQDWQSRPLSSVYPIVWLDAIHYKVRQDGRVVTKAVYSIVGTNHEGYKEVLGLYLGENEGVCNRDLGWPNINGDDGKPERTDLLEPGKFNSPHGLAIDKDGHLYVAEWLIGGRFTKLAKL